MPGFEKAALNENNVPLMAAPIAIEEKQEEEKGAMAFLSKSFFSIVDSAKELGGKAKTKFEEAKIGEKLVRAKDVVVEKSIEAGNFVVDKTKIAADAVKAKTVELAVFFFMD